MRDGYVPGSPWQPRNERKNVRPKLAATMQYEKGSPMKRTIHLEEMSHNVEEGTSLDREVMEKVHDKQMNMLRETMILRRTMVDGHGFGSSEGATQAEEEGEEEEVIVTDVALLFKDVSYRLKEGFACFGKERDIIRDVSGYVREGELLAILGGSGAGKSTLLDVLAKRKEEKMVRGTIEYSGKEMKRRPLPWEAAYVEQEDAFLPTLTVKETMTFGAMLRMPLTRTDTLQSVSRRRDRTVEELLNQLHLSHAANSPVGDAALRGISGGEKRRLSVALELLADPDVLFLDEPTSGLDSVSALELVQVSREGDEGF